MSGKKQRKGPKARKRAAQAQARQQPPATDQSYWQQYAPTSLGGIGGEQEGAHAREQTRSMGSKKEESSESWWDYLMPTAKWGGESSTQYARLDGDDDSHVDVLSSQTKSGLSLSMGSSSAKGKAEYEKKMALLDVAKKGTLSAESGLTASGGTSMAVGQGIAGAKGSFEADSTGNVSGEAEIGLGAYAMAAEASGELGIPIPFTNTRLMAGMTAGGNMGVGGKAEGHFGFGEKGPSVGGSVTGAMGLGGQLGFSAAFQKRDPTQESWL